MSSLEPRPFWETPVAPVQSGWPLPELPAADRSLAVEGPDEPSPETLAYQAGYEAGVLECSAQANSRVRPAIETLGAVAVALQGAENTFRAQLERNLYALAIAVAQKVIQREITTDPTIVLALIRQAVDLLPADGPLDVRLHPADMAALGSHLDLYSAAGRALSIAWIEDPALEQGQFLLESPQRLVDGRPDVALRALYQALTND